MYSGNLSDAFSRCLELLAQPAPAVSRSEFAAGFAVALWRLETSGDDADGRRADSLQSALGAASVEQWELALAFVAASMRTATMGAESDRRNRRRAIVPLDTLRRRFAAVIHQAETSTRTTQECCR
jgi:hypothetical protein